MSPHRRENAGVLRKTLQRKFVRTAMAAVSALLLLLLMGFNLFNWYQVNQQTDRMLQAVLQNDHVLEPLLPPDQPPPGPGQGWQEVFPPEMQEDIQEVARHRLLSMLALSTGGVVLCWLGMLALVMLLSRKAIEPIADNMERQKQFVTNAGHELKTPLAIIQANTDAMELHQGESKWSRNIRTQTVRLSGLMQNLLTLAKMDEGGNLPPARPVDLSLLAQESVQVFQEAAALRGLVLEENVTPGLVLPADREHMTQLLSILLDNAVKYTDSGGQIALTLERAGAGVCLRVRNAPARLPEDVSRLFDRFYRGDPARTQKNGGYGIGLSAAKAIVQAWKGSIDVSSDCPSDGANDGAGGVVEFCVTFPVP